MTVLEPGKHVHCFHDDTYTPADDETTPCATCESHDRDSGLTELVDIIPCPLDNPAGCLDEMHDFGNDMHVIPVPPWSPHVPAALHAHRVTPPSERSQRGID